MQQVQYLQDPDSIGRPSSLPPSRYADDVVASLDEVVLLAVVEGKLDALVHVLGPVRKTVLCKRAR